MKQAVTVLAATAILALAGCGSTPESSDEAQDQAAQTAKSAASSSTSAETTGADAETESAGDTVAESGSTSGKSGSASDLDVMFLQMMVSQQKDTAKLVKMADGKQVSSGTSKLVKAIGATQADEANSMAAWLRKHDQATTAEADLTTHAQHGGSIALTAADLTQLRQAKGKDFESQLLNILLGQQHNAIQLARTTIQADGAAWVEKSAKQVDRTRTSEVAQMLRMLAKIPVS